MYTNTQWYEQYEHVLLVYNAMRKRTLIYVLLHSHNGTNSYTLMRTREHRYERVNRRTYATVGVQSDTRSKAYILVQTSTYGIPKFHVKTPLGTII